MSSIFDGVLDANNLIRFQPNLKLRSIRAFGDNPKRHQRHLPQSGTSKSSSTPARNLEMSFIFGGVLDAFKLNRFQPNFKQGFLRAYADHPKTASRTPAPVRNIHNHHQLQQKLKECHPSLRGFLMPSKSSHFNQILNIAPSGEMQTIHNVVRDTSPSQEHQ